MKIGILTIGNELTSGRIADTNTSYLAREFHVRGWDVPVSVAVGDYAEAIGEAAFVEQAEHHIEDLRSGFLDLIEEHHGERLLADALDPGRRASVRGREEPLRGTPAAVLTHIQADQGIFIAK